MILVCPWPWLTVTAEHQWRGWTLNSGLRDRVRHHAGVVANVWGLHFSDVQVPCLLRDKATGVLLHEGRVLIEDPGKYQICWHKKIKKIEDHLKSQSEKACGKRGRSFSATLWMNKGNMVTIFLFLRHLKKQKTNISILHTSLNFSWPQFLGCQIQISGVIAGFNQWMQDWQMAWRRAVSLMTPT